MVQPHKLTQKQIDTILNLPDRSNPAEMQLSREKAVRGTLQVAYTTFRNSVQFQLTPDQVTVNMLDRYFDYLNEDQQDFVLTNL